MYLYVLQYIRIAYIHTCMYVVHVPGTMYYMQLNMVYTEKSPMYTCTSI